MPGRTLLKSGRMTVAFDVGKNTGYAICTKSKNGNNIFKHGSGNPFEVAEIIKKESKKVVSIHFLFCYDQPYLNGKTTSTLKNYKKMIVEPFLFSYPEIKISIFDEATVSYQFLEFKSDNKKEDVFNAIKKLSFAKVKDYDESDALMLLVWFIRKKSLIVKKDL